MTIYSSTPEPNTYRLPRITSIHSPLNKNHRCTYGASNRCACGRHREPAPATSLRVSGTDAERLAVEL